MKSFAQSTGLAANSKSGNFHANLLGKVAEGLDALEAIGQLASGKFNRFMELAMQAAKVAKQTLESAKTIPFASVYINFNPTLNIEKASLRGPGLGGSSHSRGKRSASARKKE